MEDLNINRDKPDMTDEQILKHKNFNAVMNTAATTVIKPWYKVGKFWVIGGVAVVGTIVTALIVANINDVVKSVNEPKNQLVEQEVTANTDVIVLETKTEDASPFKIFHIPNDRVAHSPLGITIEVPVGVITSDRGIDKDEYDVRITTLGIPEGLSFSSHSEKECFQIDLSANGEKVDLYGADAMMIKDDKIRILEFGENGWLEIEASKYTREVIQIDSISTMLMPIQNTTRPFSFGEGFDIKEKIQKYSEIANYNNVVFQPNQTWPEEWYDSTMWEGVDVDRITLGKYRLKLKKLSVVKECDVTIVFEKGNYLSAVEVYNSSFSKTEISVPEEGFFFVLKNGGKYVVLYP